VCGGQCAGFYHLIGDTVPIAVYLPVVWFVVGDGVVFLVCVPGRFVVNDSNRGNVTQGRTGSEGSWFAASIW